MAPTGAMFGSEEVSLQGGDERHTGMVDFVQSLVVCDEQIYSRVSRSSKIHGVGGFDS